MLHRFLGPLAAVFTAFSLLAAPQLTSISPSAGFPYGGSHVTLLGSDLVAEFVHCEDKCQNPGVCPVTVLFGGVPGEVQYAIPDRILVIAPPHAEGNVDVTVKVTGRPTVTRTNFFTYDDNAESAAIDYARYLVPVVSSSTPGANGSTWVTETTILNASSHTAQLLGPFRCVIGSPTICAQSGFAAGEYAQLDLEPRANGEGAFIYVPRPLDRDVAFESRVRDTSRTSENWGAEIPLVRVNEFAYAMQLLDVPTIPRYRATLRIYSSSPTRAHVVIYQPFTQDPIEEMTVELTGDVDNAGLFPLYAQLDPLTPAVRAVSNGNPVQIAVFADNDSLADPPPTIWAFVSITNNESQQVTTVTPHK